jgi:hypothetical protein
MILNSTEHKNPYLMLLFPLVRHVQYNKNVIGMALPKKGALQFSKNRCSWMHFNYNYFCLYFEGGL